MLFAAPNLQPQQVPPPAPPTLTTETMLGSSSAKAMRPAFYSEATLKVGYLELCLGATQAAVSTAEGETSAARVMLASVDAGIAGWVIVSMQKKKFSTQVLS